MSFATVYASFKIALNVLFTWFAGWVGKYGDLWVSNLIQKIPNAESRRILTEIFKMMWPYLQPIIMTSGARRAYLILQTVMMPTWLKFIFWLPYLLYALPFLSGAAKAAGA